VLQWRVLTYAAALVSVVLFVVMLLMPETPAYLLSNELVERAKAAVDFLGRRSMDLDGDSVAQDVVGAGTTNSLIPGTAENEVDAGAIDLDAEAKGVGSRSAPRGADAISKEGVFAMLLAPRLRRAMTIGISLMFFQQFSGINAVIFYSGSILQTAGMDNANVAGSYVMATQVFFTGVACLLMDRAGRKPLLSISSIGMGICITCLGIFFANNKHPSWLALVALMGYIAFFSLAMGPVPWLIMSEIFPENVRGPACSVATLANWAGGFLVTYFFSTIVDVLSPTVVFFLFGAVCAACAVFVNTMVPETKGKSLAELEKELVGP